MRKRPDQQFSSAKQNAKTVARSNVAAKGRFEKLPGIFESAVTEPAGRHRIAETGECSAG